MKKIISVLPVQECTVLVSDVTYKMERGWFGATLKPLKMDLILPKHYKEPRPLLVWICGGGFMAVDKDVWVPELVYFAKQGFVVASVEYRTSNEKPFPAQLIDVKAAIRFLRAHAEEFCIDPQKVFVMGESAGGALASLVGTTGDTTEFDVGPYLNQSSKVQGVIDLYGVVDMSMCNEQSEEMKKNMWSGAEPIDLFLCGQGRESELAHKASAVNYISKNTPPFLLFHGTADSMVPVEQSRRFYDELQKSGIFCDYYELEGSDHGADEFYQSEMLEIMAQFMKKICADRS